MQMKTFTNKYRKSFRLVSLMLLAVLAPLVCSCAHQSTTTLPGITADTKGVYHPGRFIWFELLTENPKMVHQFYSELFGWTFAESVSHRDYSTIVLNGKEIGGMLRVDGTDPSTYESRWICSVSVNDVDEASNKVTRLGGRVLFGPVDAGDRGRLAQVSDPQGADFILLHALHGDPKKQQLEPGNPVWVDLFTKDTAASVSFYMGLFGYEAVKSDEDLDYFHFAIDDKIKAGMTLVDWDDLESTWLPYIGVDNLREAVLKAISLGGTLLVHTETAAVVLDPAGAAIGLQLLPGGGV